MKDAAYAAIFELMFKFALAYSDEPRPVSYKDSKGETRYEEFNRYDFLEQGEDGFWHWNDQFLFSCDTSAPLASNREAMWQETRGVEPETPQDGTEPGQGEAASAGAIFHAWESAPSPPTGSCCPWSGWPEAMYSRPP